MSYFEKINAHWRKAFDIEINEVDGGSYPDIATAFKEYHSQYLSEVVIDEKPNELDTIMISSCYCDFKAGWGAALNHADR